MHCLSVKARACHALAVHDKEVIPRAGSASMEQTKPASHLKGPFPEPFLASWCISTALAEANVAEDAGNAPGGMLWLVHSALLAAASCSRRPSASSVLRASSAFSCPAASSLACAIHACVNRAIPGQDTCHGC